MFFNDIKNLPDIAKKTNFSIFALDPKDETLQNLLHQHFPTAFYLSPNEKGKIDIAEVRRLIESTRTKETKDRFIIVNHAESILEAAQNALLKLLEEPKNHYFFILLTPQPSLLLPTILSRGQLFILREQSTLDTPPTATPEIINLAKRLLIATPRDLLDIASDITAHKVNTREFALEVISTTVELAYKSFLKTNNPKFLARLPDFITLHHNIQMNSHIKLHIVADLC